MESRGESARHPLVSVGIPVHNPGPLLHKAIESVLAQDYDPLEIVISDDGSEEASAEMCRAFAQHDSRVRYRHDPVNHGALENFQRVVRDAKGSYFTWLAQDDFLEGTQALRIPVEFLEGHPDVVLAANSTCALDYEWQGQRIPGSFPALHPEKPWRSARRELFRWPQKFAWAIYGMYRREALLELPFRTRYYRNQPVMVGFEYPILTGLAARGRIVALPEILRNFRMSPVSHGSRELVMFSPFDRMLLGFGTKFGILKNAWRTSLPISEKLDLLAVAAGNFAIHNLSRPNDYSGQIVRLHAELAMLERVAEKRLRLIETVQMALDQLHGHSPGASSTPPGYKKLRDLLAFTPGRMAALPVRISRQARAFMDFFRPPAADLKKEYLELLEKIGRWRQFCEEREQTLKALSAKLETARVP